MMLPAQADDLSAMEALLTEAGLPLAGVAEHWADFLVVRRDGRVVGMIGLEVYGQHGLMRSVAVEAGARRTGLGEVLVRGMMAAAQQRGLCSLTLLTTDAAGYFARFGFAGVEAAAVPAAVKQSIEFRGACPASATVMMLAL